MVGGYCYRIVIKGIKCGVPDYFYQLLEDYFVHVFMHEYY